MFANYAGPKSQCLGTVGLVIALSLVSPAPGHATDVNVGQLHDWHDVTNWQHVANSDCNYMYVNPTNHKLLYYGTSATCKTRLSQHDNAILYTRTVINSYESAINDRVRAKKITESEGRELKGQAGRYLSNSKFNGDDCLAIQSVWVQYKIYSIDLSHLMKGAAAVEDCVLKKAKGTCNSVGSGSTRAESQTLTDAILGCMK
jgi:predicted GIY-YIG superfamily endonuclease